MSQKKHKKRHPQSNRRPSSAPVAESEFSSDGKRKRMNRTPRNILLFTLVLLASVQLLIQAEMMSEEIANVLSMVALALLVLALWLQFRNPSGGGQTKSGGPRLR